MMIESAAFPFVAHAEKYWTLANVLTGFYFVQALAFWYKLGEPEFAGKLRPIARAILTTLWIQALAVAGLVYGSFYLEQELLGERHPIAVTSEFACYARLSIILAMTILSTIIVLFTSGRLRRVHESQTPPGSGDVQRSGFAAGADA
jgi:hypothetical protein